MLRNTIIAFAFAAASLGLTGCELYFDEPSGSDTWSYCDDTGCWTCDEWGCWPSDGSGGPGWSCADNKDCAAGCYCSDEGYCEEAGFCSGDEQCPAGFICDDRASCVPEGSTGSCESHADCPAGAYCEEDSGECVESDTCETGDDCSQDGFVCDDSGTCVPGEEPTLVCQGEVTCETVPPACPLGSTPAIDVDTGCYTGDCIDNAECPDGNPCASNTEDQCIAAAECTAVYSGTNCTDPNGNACNANEANCTCESYTYTGCEEAETPEQ